MNQRTIYSCGYGNLSLTTFLENLQKNNIQLLVDVRTNPYSRFRPEFNKKAFELYLVELGIVYTHKPELGGKPKEEGFYTKGKLNYDKLRTSTPYLKGLEYLEKEVESEVRVAIMCSELNYLDCHRYKLIGEDLHQRGWKVLHLDKQGNPISHTTGLF